MECLFTACLVVLHFCLPLARLDIVVSVNGGILAESGWDASSDTDNRFQIFDIIIISDVIN